MRLDLRMRGLPSDSSARDRISRRLYDAFGRLTDRIARLTVTLEPSREPAHGRTVRCHLRLESVDGGAPLVVEDRDPEASVALHRAALRLSRSVDRSRGRRRRRSERSSRRLRAAQREGDRA